MALQKSQASYGVACSAWVNYFPAEIGTGRVAMFMALLKRVAVPSGNLCWFSR